jgi:hypothetical protein
MSNDPEKPTFQLLLKATVRKLVEVIPQPMIQLTANSGQSAEGKVTIVNRDKKPLKIEGIDSIGDDFKAHLRTVEEGNKYELSVKLNPKTLGGRVTAQVTVRTNNPKSPQVVIPVSADVTARIQANPQIVDFGQVSLKMPDTVPQSFYTKGFSLRSQEKGFMVRDVKSTLAFVKPEVKPPSRDGLPYRINVTLLKEKIKKGKIEGSIVVATNDKQFSEVRIPVRGQVN